MSCESWLVQKESNEYFMPMGTIKKIIFGLLPNFAVKWIKTFVLMLRSYEVYAKETDKQRLQLKQLDEDVEILKSEIHRLRTVSNLNQYLHFSVVNSNAKNSEVQ